VKRKKAKTVVRWRAMHPKSTVPLIGYASREMAERRDAYLLGPYGWKLYRVTFREVAPRKKRRRAK
jgi:hypothetical protein